MLHSETLPGHSLELLKKISPELKSRGFYLAGGTALALRMGHRISVDLDFFTEKSFDSQELIVFLHTVAGEAPLITQQTKGSVCVILDETKVELFHYPYALLSDTEAHEGIILSSLFDNGVMKISALMNRGSKKDFCDFAALLEIESLSKWLEVFKRKYPTTDIFSVVKSLTWFDDAEQEPDPVFLKQQVWVDVKSKIVAAVAAL